MAKTKDLKADNFLLGFKESSVIEDYARRLKESPPLCKEVDGHPIYQSAADFGDLKKGVGLLKISDFGAAVYGNVSTRHFSMGLGLKAASTLAKPISLR